MHRLIYYTLSIDHSLQRCSLKLQRKAIAVVIAAASAIKLLIIYRLNYIHLIPVKQVSMTVDDLDYVFVDVQGFKIFGDIFVPKEFCLLHEDFEFHAVVKSPCEYKQLLSLDKRGINWLTSRYHGLHFNAGTISIAVLAECTLEHVDGKIVIVKGTEKVKWVQDIYKKWCNTSIHCVNIERTDPLFRFQLKPRIDIDDICPHHQHICQSKICHCALSHAHDLRQLFTNE